MSKKCEHGELMGVIEMLIKETSKVLNKLHEMKRQKELTRAGGTLFTLGKGAGSGVNTGKLLIFSRKNKGN